MQTCFIKLTLAVFIFILGHQTTAQDTPFSYSPGIIHSLIKRINEFHLNPKPINDDFSEQLFHSIFNQLDAKRLYFTKEDLMEFSAFKYQLDEELISGKFTFIPLLSERYKTRLKESEGYCLSILSQKLSFEKKQIYTFPNLDSLIFPSSSKMIEQWDRWLCFHVLQTLYGFDKKVDSHTESFNKENANAEAQARKIVARIEKRYVQRIVDSPSNFEQLMSNQYLSLIASQFDPHTAYISKEELSSLEAALSPNEYTFGFEIEQDLEGTFYVSNIYPGGPAWNSGKMNKGDLIINIYWKGESTIDLIDIDSEDLDEILSMPTVKILVVELQKTMGTRVEVELKKDKLEVDENNVKSYLLEGTTKLGYISLPAFYSDWESTTQHGCANDVAKEIIKLTTEHVEGIILDLRNNGGGATYESLMLLGLFIDEGPLFIKQTKGGALKTIKDLNRGTLYDGPLLVMINGQSASASEIVASALQDYKRAIIVGSNSYGKATEQTLINLITGNPLRDFNPSNSENKIGIGKITANGLYRINGKSNQCKGVVPDILLPEINTITNSKESDYLSALKPVLIEKNIPVKAGILPLEYLVQKSANRVNALAVTKEINDLNEQQAFLKKAGSITIELSHYEFKRITKRRLEWSTLSDKLYNDSNDTFIVKQHTNFNASYLSKTFSSSTVNNAMKAIEKDCYVQECYAILSDYIGILK